MRKFINFALQQNTTLPEALVYHFTVQLLAIVSDMHEYAILHEPDNIMSVLRHPFSTRRTTGPSMMCWLKTIRLWNSSISAVASIWLCTPTGRPSCIVSTPTKAQRWGTANLGAIRYSLRKKSYNLTRKSRKKCIATKKSQTNAIFKVVFLIPQNYKKNCRKTGKRQLTPDF